MRWLLIFKGIFWLSANGRSQLKVNISPLPVTDILEIRLFKAAEMSQKNRNRIFRSNHNAFQKPREEIN